MRLQKSGAQWAPSDIDAQRLTDQLRASRLTVLCGGPAAPTAQVLRAGVLPRVHRRLGDRRGAERPPAPRTLAFEDRRRASLASDAEVVVLFDAWTVDARAGLKEELLQAVKGHPVWRGGGAALPQRIDDLLIALSERHRVRYLIVFDRFEDCLLAPADNPDLRALREEIFVAINRPQVPAHVLLTLREEAEPLLDRLRGRIRGFEAVRKPFPLDGAQGIGPWTMSWVPPVLAQASRPLQTQAVYASIEALLGQMAQRSGGGQEAPRLSAEDEALLAPEDAPAHDVPPPPSSFGPSRFAAYGLDAAEWPSSGAALLATDRQVGAGGAGRAPTSPTSRTSPSFRVGAAGLTDFADWGPGALDSGGGGAQIGSQTGTQTDAEVLAGPDAENGSSDASDTARAEPSMSSAAAPLAAARPLRAPAAPPEPFLAPAALARVADQLPRAAPVPALADVDPPWTPRAPAAMEESPRTPSALAAAEPPETPQGTGFDADSLSHFMTELDDVLSESGALGKRRGPPTTAAALLDGLADWPDAAPPRPGADAALLPEGAARAAPSGMAKQSQQPPLSDGTDIDAPPVARRTPAPVRSGGRAAAAVPSSEAHDPVGAADVGAPPDRDRTPPDVPPDVSSDVSPDRADASPDHADTPSNRADAPPPRTTTTPPRSRRTPAGPLVALVALALGLWAVLTPQRADDAGTATSTATSTSTDTAASTSAALPSEADPPAAGRPRSALAPLVELSAAGPLAQGLADELAQTLPPGAGPTLLVRATGGWADDLGALRQPGRLAIVRQDALQAARADAALGPLQIVLPLFTEELVFVVRADSPLRYIHQIENRRLSTGDPASARALSVRAAYQQLFGRLPPANRIDTADEPTALRALLDGGVDVVALVGTVPGSWPVAPALSDATRLRLLRLDPAHRSSQRALRWLVPAQLAAGVDGLPAEQPTPTLAVRSFLVASAASGGAARDSELGGLARAVCRQLPTLQRDGHAKWREVQIGAMPPAGWPYAPEAAFALQDCVGRLQP